MRNLIFRRYTVVEVSAVSHKGKIRKNNEDYYRLVFPNTYKHFRETLLVLADGMGGYNNGEVASKLAVNLFIDFYRKSKEKRLINKIYNALINTNKNVYNEALKNDKYSGMGTTIALLVIYNDFAVIANIGDSRIYHYSNNILHQLSEDHSWVKEIGLTDEEAKLHPKRNIITRTIGKKADVIPYLHTVPIKKGDIFLLCSDGLTTHVSDQQINKVLGSSVTLQEKQNFLLKLALDAGGSDNITIILAQPSKIRRSKKTYPKRRLLSLIIILFVIFFGFTYWLSYGDQSINNSFPIQILKRLFTKQITNYQQNIPNLMKMTDTLANDQGGGDSSASARDLLQLKDRKELNKNSTKSPESD